MSKKVSAFSNDVLGIRDAVEIAQLIKSKKISSAEVIRAAIERAEIVNPDLNAFVLKTYDQAKNKILQDSDSLLLGIPTVIKDNIPLEGLPTQNGTYSFQAKNEKKTGKYATQYLSTGMVSIGKSALPEFGLICSTENPNWGITRNPWNTDYTTGGSSSGSSALVAAGVVPIASANDGGGSTRIPASCCGLVGLKPTRGRLVYTDGTNLLPINIVHEGVVTRSVRDTAAFYAETEKFFKNPKMPSIGHVQSASSQRLKVLYFENNLEGSLGHQDQDTFNTIKENMKLMESLGHQVDIQPFPIRTEDYVNDFLAYYGFLSTAQILFAKNIDKNRIEPFTSGLSKYFKKNVLKFPSSLRRLKKAGKHFDEVFNSYDVVVTPVLAHETPKIGYFSIDLPYEEITRRVTSFTPFAAIQNISGSPAISLPMGFSRNGLPIGLQYCAAFGQDKRLLELAYELEAAQPWKFIFNK